jgi:GNAT superfamily N-acetyltransferase
MKETNINPSDADVADDVGLTPAAAFLKEADELWPEVSQFYRFTVEGQEVGAFCLDDIQEDDEVGVSLIKVRSTLAGAGYGTMMLNALCGLADKHDVALRLEILPTGRLTEQDLKGWYERRGFVPGTNSIFDEGPVMSRSPHAQPEDALTASL